MNLKAIIIPALTRDELKQAVNDLGLPNVDRRSPSSLRKSLKQARRATPEKLLRYLNKAKLRLLCEDSGIPSKGPRKELTERLLALEASDSGERGPQCSLEMREANAPEGENRELGDENAFFRRVNDEAFPHIDAATVPIYGFQDKQVKLDRTGVLFRIADSHFILTAAHGLQDIIQAGIPLLADFSTRHRIPIPLAKGQFCTTEEKGGRDVAAILIPPSVVADLPAHRRFLTMADVDTESQAKRGFYAVFGFPTAWYRRVEDVQRNDPLAFVASIYEGELNPDAFFDPKVHIALTFERSAINALTGEPRELPPVEGMSGCGLWRIANYSRKEIVAWSADKIRLVALQHRWFKQRQYIQGTWIAYALGLIRDTHPSLREAMKLSYPRGY